MADKNSKLEMGDLEPRARDVNDQEADEVTGGSIRGKKPKLASAGTPTASSVPSKPSKPSISITRGPSLTR